MDNISAKKLADKQYKKYNMLLKRASSLKITKKWRWIFLGDIVDHMKIFTLIKQNQFSKAAKTLYYLDTSSREEFNSVLYSFLMDQR